MKPMTIIVIGVAIAAAAWVLKDYIPRRDNPEIGRLQRAAAYAKVREAAAENRLAAKEQEIEHSHALVVHDTAQVHRQKLAYDFGKSHLDTTSTDSLKAQLSRADSVIDSQAKTIVDVSAEKDAALAALGEAKDALNAADYRSESLERLNKGVERELADRQRGQWRHDAKVVLATLAARSGIQLLTGR